MKTFKIFALLAILVLVVTATAQDNAKSSEIEKPKMYKADPKDVESIDAILTATYAAISGGVGEARNWERFHSLFHPSAHLIPTGKNPQTGITAARSLTPQEYVERSGDFLVKNGFIEKEIARRIEKFGNIAHVFSTYEGTYSQDGKPATIRGINSFQLMNDGKRWWVMNIFWQAESEGVSLPEKYLQSDDSKS